MQPRVNIVYNGIKVVTDELSENEFFIESISYTDRRTGAADDIDIELFDKNNQWKNKLLPEKGDTIKVEFVQGDQKMTTPECYVDGADWTKPAYAVRLRGLSYLYEKKSDIRKKKNLAYDNTTLRTLIQSIAQRNKLRLIWFGTDQSIKDTWQRNTSDYEFIKKLAKEFGAFFKIYNKKLIWAVSTDNYVFTQQGQEVTADTSGSGQRFVELPDKLFKDLMIGLKSNKKSSTQWESLDVFNKKLNKVLGKKSDDLELGPISADKIGIKTTIENKAVGSVSKDYLEGDLSIRGIIPISNLTDVRAAELLAGTVIFLPDQGHLSGTYVIENAAHIMSATGGWSVTIDAARLSSKDLPKITSVGRYNKRIANKKAVKDAIKQASIVVQVAEESVKAADDAFDLVASQAAEENNSKKVKASNDVQNTLKDPEPKSETTKSKVGFFPSLKSS